MEAFIAGTVSSSIVNWPSKTSFLVLFAGCDFKCPYCFSSDYIEQKAEYKVNLRDIKKEIKENKNFVDGVVFSGAEPCMQKAALVYLAGYCKSLKLGTGLETNGSNPEAIKALLEKRLLDFVALDLKSPFDAEIFEKITNSKTFFRTTSEVMENIKQSIEILKENNDQVQIEARTTIVPGMIYRREDILDIAKQVDSLKSKWRLQGFRSDVGRIKSPKFRNINPPTKEFIQDLKKQCKKEYPNLKIELEL